MIIAWLIGLLLSAIVIYIYLGTKVYRKDKPILSRLGLIAMIILALIPIASIIGAIVLFLVWIFQTMEFWDYTRKPGKILKWLNERV